MLPNIIIQDDIEKINGIYDGNLVGKKFRIIH